MDFILILPFRQAEDEEDKMKRTILMSYIALAIAVVLSAAAGRGTESAPEETAPPVESSVSETTPQTLSAPERISLLTGDGILEMDMQEYLIGVVAAEMPATFPDEALKAQAVAARTYAMNCAAGEKHGDAQVCADYKCCQAWQNDAALREKWGADYDMYLEKISAAVAATAGQYLSYDGEAVFAAFHSSSAGATEASGSIWSTRPYLISVSSPETEEDVPNFVSRVDCSELDFRDTLLSAHPEADFTGDASGWVGEISRDESGRVASVVLGGVSVAGTELRSLFSLRSTAFELEYDGGFHFTVRGYGHGVGMSQYGAKVMAEDGADYRAILAHYYPGCELIG